MKRRKFDTFEQSELFVDIEPFPEQDLFGFDYHWKKQGYCRIAGTDEAGRGPLAGPVVAAAVILPANVDLPYLNDSKKLSVRRRDVLFDAIMAQATSVSWSCINAAEIDKLNVYHASRLAMVRAVSALRSPFDIVLSDAMPLSDLSVPCIPIIRGDAKSASIAAASIIAKVIRDRIMLNMDELYPQYGFARHKGYGTADHLAVLKKIGPCVIHRQSFAPIKTWRSPNGEDR